MLTSARWLLPWIAVVGSAALAGCGPDVSIDPSNTSTSVSGSTATGGSGGTTSVTTTPTTPPPSVEEACTTYWEARCSKLTACFPTTSAAFFGDHASCMTSMVQDCVNGYSAAGTQTDTSKIVACAEAFANTSCEDINKQSAGEIDAGPCGPSPGVLATGAACGVNDQCASAICDVPVGEVCGRCAPGDLGTSCDSSWGCKVGLTCAEGKCVSVGQLGDACSLSAPCSVALACIGGTCAPLVPAGSMCADIQSEYSPCVAGTLCNPESKVCEPYTTAQLGAQCGIVNGKFYLCAKGSYCHYDAFKADICFASLADGEPCTVGENLYDPCDYPSRCVQGACRYPDPNQCQ